MKPALILDERAIRVQLLRTTWTGTAVGAVVATTHPAAAPRTDGDAIVIQSLPPRPSRYGGRNGGQQRGRHGGCRTAAAASEMSARSRVSQESG